MRVAVLGEGLNSCLLLKHQGITVLLDASSAPYLVAAAAAAGPLQPQHQHQLPNQLRLALPRLNPALQLGPIDAILITSPYGLLGIPHLQQRLAQQGQVLPLHLYCTEPCYHSFQQLAMELLQVQELLLHHNQQQLASQHSGYQATPRLAPQCQTPQHSLLQQQLQQHVQQLYLQQQQQMHQVQQVEQMQMQFMHQQQQQHWWATHARGPGTSAHPQPIVPPPAAAVPAQPAAVRGWHENASSSSSIHSTLHGTVTQPHGATGVAAAAAAIPPPRPPPAPPTTPYPGTQQDTPAAAAAANDSDGNNQQQGVAAAVPLFTPQQLQATLDALQVVRLGQRLLLPGAWGLTAEPRPAGASFDCCMWLLTTGSQKVAYLSPASLYPNPSAALHAASLAACDALLVGPCSICPDLDPPLHNPTQQLLQLAASTAATAAMGSGARVLLPVATSGALLQLLEAIPAALDALGPRGTSVPMFLLSPAGPDCLATADSCCEYLEQSRQQAVLAAGQPPFRHKHLAKHGRLRVIAGAGAGAGNDWPASQQQQGSSGDGRSCSGVLLGHAALPDDCRPGNDGASGSGGGRLQAAAVEAAVREVLAAGPCVVFVPLWSLAAGAGAMLASACCSNPQDVLLLTEQGPLTAAWLQQCCSSSSSSAGGSQGRPGWLQPGCRWRVQYSPVGSTAGAMHMGTTGSSSSVAGAGGGVPGHVVGGCLTASQLLQLVRGLGVRRLLLGERDRQLLDACMQWQRTSLAECSVQTLPSQGTSTGSTSTSSSSSSSLVFLAVDLPDPLIEVHLSRELSKQLMLTPLVLPGPAFQAEAAPEAATGAGSGTGSAAATTAAAGRPDAGVSVARVQGLLTCQAGCYRLLPLPTFTKPDAVAATVELQQQHVEQLVWGEVMLQQLLSDLKAAGFSQLSVSTEAAVGSMGSSNGGWQAEGPATLVQVAEDAQIRLTAGSTQIMCDSWLVRKQLLDVVTSQLNML